jgi:hypothetical protein
MTIEDICKGAQKILRFQWEPHQALLPSAPDPSMVARGNKSNRSHGNTNGITSQAALVNASTTPSTTSSTRNPAKRWP